MARAEGPAGEVHAVRSRSERSDVYSMWQISEPVGSGRARATKSRDGAEAPEQFKEGRHPRSACPEPTPLTRPTHTVPKSRGLEEQLGGGNLPWHGASIPPNCSGYPSRTLRYGCRSKTQALGLGKGDGSWCGGPRDLDRLHLDGRLEANRSIISW